MTSRKYIRYGDDIPAVTWPIKTPVTSVVPVTEMRDPNFIQAILVDFYPKLAPYLTQFYPNFGLGLPIFFFFFFTDFPALLPTDSSLQWQNVLKGRHDLRHLGWFQVDRLKLISLVY